MIRAAAHSDASQVYQLMAQLQQFAGMEVVEEAVFIRQFRRVLADPRFRAFVVEESGAIKGVITIKTYPAPPVYGSAVYKQPV